MICSTTPKLSAGLSDTLRMGKTKERINFTLLLNRDYCSCVSCGPLTPQAEGVSPHHFYLFVMLTSRMKWFVNMLFIYFFFAGGSSFFAVAALHKTFFASFLSEVSVFGLFGSRSP